MAGFDFEFTYLEEQADLLRVCVRAAMTRSRKLDISWRNTQIGAGHMRCIVDGNGRRMDFLAHALERDLPLVAEGAEAAGFSRSMRRRLGLGFADLYIVGLDVRSDAVRRWRGVSTTRYYFTPFSLAPEGAPEHLSERLTITEGVLIDWYFDRVPSAVLLEELHTACELLLEHLVNRRAKRLSFSQLVDKAEEEGLLHWPFAGIPQIPNLDGKQVLTELKDFRKNARHRADMSFEPWLRENWEKIALLIERIANSYPLPQTRSPGAS